MGYVQAPRPVSVRVTGLNEKYVRLFLVSQETNIMNLWSKAILHDPVSPGEYDYPAQVEVERYGFGLLASEPSFSSYDWLKSHR